jgi:hypothetical protein
MSGDIRTAQSARRVQACVAWQCATDGNMEHEIMRKVATTLVTAGMVGLLAAAGAAHGQSSFDSKKFWEELQSRGASMPADFDGRKFFEELERKGFNSSNRIDSKKFFEELQSRGASVPANFDGKQFFEELQRKGFSAPQMVDMKK